MISFSCQWYPFRANSQQVAGIREVLNDPTEDNGSYLTSEPSAKSGPSPDTSPTSILFGYQPHISDDELVAPVADNVREVLLNIYHDRVDCLFKATYWPAAEIAISQRYEELKKGTPCMIRPVERAIYFMAVCAMTVTECEVMLSESRNNLIYRHKRAVEIALARSDFLTNPDKLALQAFVLYLVCFEVKTLK